MHLRFLNSFSPSMRARQDLSSVLSKVCREWNEPLFSLPSHNRYSLFSIYDMVQVERRE